MRYYPCVCGHLGHMDGACLTPWCGCRSYQPTSDPVTAPAHYTQGGIECKDAIRASMSVEAWRGYCKGNVMKYLWRYEAKGGVEDLRKAQVYLSWLVAALELEEVR